MPFHVNCSGYLTEPFEYKHFGTTAVLVSLVTFDYANQLEWSARARRYFV